jgi:hypothetical protein
MLQELLNKYPFGSYVISSGIGMAALAAFTLALKPLGRILGDWLPYALVAVVAISVMGVRLVNVRYPSRVTVPLGILGWLLALMLLLMHNWT